MKHIKRILKKRDIGKAPDELIFRGEQKTDQVAIRILDFNADLLKEKQEASAEVLLQYKDAQKQTVTWINIDGLHNLSLMEDLGKIFNFDRLVLAEVMNTDSRPTLVDYDNCTLITLKMLQFDEESNAVHQENLSLIFTESVVLTFQEKRGDVFDPIRERIRKHKKRIRHGGTDYLVFALLDIVVDNYLHVISMLGDRVETLEENLLSNPNHQVINQINQYKRELNFLRRSIKPAKEMMFSLAKMESEYISDSTGIHFKALLENISLASDTTDSYRDILSDQLNIYHTTISSNLNDVMKFLTVFSVVFIPLTFIAGIYGTNFEYVPELKYRYSYFLMWGVMLLVAVGMLLYFKRKKWL